VTATNDRFALFYSRRRQEVGLPYKDTEFLYPNNEPWPEQSFDYPYGQAPTVSNIPPAEADDWQKNVGQYYVDNAVGSITHPTPFGIKAADFARKCFAQNGLTGYGDVTDDLFTELLCEGLYSKYLSPIDPQDRTLFGLQDEPGWEYLKSDQSCMMVVTKPWAGEYVAPGIALFRRPVPYQKPAFGSWKQYQLVAIALARSDGKGGPFAYSRDLVFTQATHSAGTGWWLAKYFVLQGAIHRINLVDHIKVHFPGDCINAITKSVLPRWHLINQLLLPHFRLTLPVNNAVLEGQRSIINRDTWYPWSPVTARGDEIRKLIPLAWAGGDYYWGQRNVSYLRYYWSNDPRSIPDPAAPDSKLPTFIGLDTSLYGQFLLDYHGPVLDYARAVVAQLPQLGATPDDDGIEWLEIRRWAHEVAALVPGFPDDEAIRDPDLLARVCATIIWNAAIVHSSDHATLHMMIDKHPVPFILRINPPADNSVTGVANVQDHVGDDADQQALKDKHKDYVRGPIQNLEGLIRQGLVAEIAKIGGPLGTIANKLGLGDGINSVVDGVIKHMVDSFDSHLVQHGSVPLCWPTDLVYCKMADLLFYRPHNSSLLYDCSYEFLQDEAQMTPAERALYESWRKELGRPVVSDAQRQALVAARQAFQGALSAVNARYYKADGTPTWGEPEQADDIPCVMNRYGFPKLLPGTADKDVAGTRMECCFGAGIQY
jgi:hypothetical protein